jgi:rSAM/selenodomain-associated transferase 1
VSAPTIRSGVGVLVVFAKAPRPGQVKTRMCPPLTPEQAADFYAAMLDDVLAATAAFAPPLGLAPVLAVHPADACAALARRAPLPFRIVRQRGASLAGRMQWAVHEALAAGAERVLLRGSDSPTLGADAVGEALAALDDHDVSLRPDRDGGYTLVGLRRGAAGLFDHRMSTGRVLADTLENADRLGFSVAVGAEGFDLDTVADVAHLLGTLGHRTEGVCPRTCAWLKHPDRREIMALP